MFEYGNPHSKKSRCADGHFTGLAEFQSGVPVKLMYNQCGNHVDGVINSSYVRWIGTVRPTLSTSDENVNVRIGIRCVRF